MTYGEVNAPNKSHVLLTTYLHKVTWQTENGIYGEAKAHNNQVTQIWSRDDKRTNWKLNISSSARPMQPHLLGWWGMTLWPWSLVRSHEKLKTEI